MKTGRILVASRGAEMRGGLRCALELEGHLVAEVETARQTIEETSTGLHDVLLLDSVLDGTGPYELCRAIRPKSDLGIILLSRDQSGQGRIDALNAGADDYVPDRFVFAELLARVRAILRRVTHPAGHRPRIVLEDRAIDFQSHQIHGPD